VDRARQATLPGECRRPATQGIVLAPSEVVTIGSGGPFRAAGGSVGQSGGQAWIAGLFALVAGGLAVGFEAIFSNE
jgi:hypothetical protein